MSFFFFFDIFDIFTTFCFIIYLLFIAGDIAIIDPYTVIYRQFTDVSFFLLGAKNENEMLLYNVLDSLIDALANLLPLYRLLFRLFSSLSSCSFSRLPFFFRKQCYYFASFIFICSILFEICIYTLQQQHPPPPPPPHPHHPQCVHRVQGGRRAPRRRLPRHRRDGRRRVHNDMHTDRH